MRSQGSVAESSDLRHRLRMSLNVRPNGEDLSVGAGRPEPEPNLADHPASEHAAQAKPS